MKKVYTDKNSRGRRSAPRVRVSIGGSSRANTSRQATSTGLRRRPSGAGQISGDQAPPEPSMDVAQEPAPVGFQATTVEPATEPEVSRPARDRSRARRAPRRRAAGSTAKPSGSVFSRYYKKVLAILLALLIVLFGVSCILVAAGSNMNTAVAMSQRDIKAPPGPKPSPPGLWANAAVLIDAESGRVLYDKNSHVKLPIASTTKMITALVVRDQLKLNDQVTVSRDAANVGEQSAGLVAGEKLSVKDLLWAMLVLSANDAGYALAQDTSGSITSFANLMNKKAAQIGARDSHFMNPHGLDQAGHYSTAYDLALIGRELLKDPVLAKMVDTKHHNIPAPPGQPVPLTLNGHNEILDRYPYATGIKTGYTAKAGFCLVASATKDNKSLISVVLNSTHRADDAIALFNYGFDSTQRIVFVDKGQRLGTSRVSAYPRRYVRVVTQEQMAALAVKGSGDTYRVQITYSRQAPGGIKAGTPLGTVKCWMNKSPIESGKVIAGSTSFRTGLIARTGAFLWYSLCWMGKIISAPFRLF